MGFAPAADAPLLTRILACRGLTAEADVRAFVDPSLLHLHDPSPIPDLDRAAARIVAALAAGEPIAIYGDYDVDGITATAILYHTCRTIAPSADVRTYIPHRLDEGYGLNSAGNRIGFVYTDCLGTRDVNTMLAPGTPLTVNELRDLNAQGKLVGVGTNAQGELRPVLLIPSSPPCSSNCDCSTATPVLTSNDFQCFLNLFVAARIPLTL